MSDTEVAGSKPGGTGLSQQELTRVIDEVRGLVENRYIFPEVAAALSDVLRRGLAEGRYPADMRSLATAATADLQSVNGDKHLRLLYSDEVLPARTPGDDAEEYAAMAQWADQACGGVACVRRLAGNVGYLDLQPVLFPVVLCGERVTAAMSLLACCDALIVDLRHCLGGEPGMSVWLASYLWDRDPVQLTGLREREADAVNQSWTLPYVPGRRYGKTKPVYVLTSATTFSGGEQLSYDLQQLGRATIVGERTRGGAHAREGFRVHPHLEATIPVAESVSPQSGGNWEGSGVVPGVHTPAGQARDAAYKRALGDVIDAGGPAAADAREALAAAQQGAG